MHKTTLISFGMKFDPWIEQTLKEYEKRLKTQTQWQWIRLKPVYTQGDSQLEQEKKRHTLILESHIPAQAHCILLDETGQNMNTQKLSTLLLQRYDTFFHLCFIIGPACGVTTDFKNQHVKIALSALTLAHPLCHAVWFEQLYRVLSLHQGHPYHREG